MAALFNFGISQEDPLTEHRVLEIKPGDRVLSLASGGEVPLTLISLTEHIKVTAVDVSEAQIRLCRLKIAAATHMDYPENGGFLGYAPMNETNRYRWFDSRLRWDLTVDDRLYWDNHQKEIRKGIINLGRVEQHITRYRTFAKSFIGKKNLQRLLECSSTDEQKVIFNQKIAKRKSIQALFKFAFQPVLYKQCALDNQAMVHTNRLTGAHLYDKFEEFCTYNPAARNYFLHYFLLGGCININAFPDYLKPENKACLLSNLDNLELKQLSFKEALMEKEKGYFNKIHLSNLGDYSTEEQFSELVQTLADKCQEGTRICARHLLRNYFNDQAANGFSIDKAASIQAEYRDRFPFYNILSILFNPTSATSS